MASAKMLRYGTCFTRDQSVFPYFQSPVLEHRHRLGSTNWPTLEGMARLGRRRPHLGSSYILSVMKYCVKLSRVHGMKTGRLRSIVKTSYVRKKNLFSTCSFILTLRHCRDFRTGMMCENLRDLTTVPARVFILYLL